jgi:hypothetical protein
MDSLVVEPRRGIDRGTVEGKNEFFDQGIGDAASARRSMHKDPSKFEFILRRSVLHAGFRECFGVVTGIRPLDGSHTYQLFFESSKG